jgi:hypothetical protein
LPIAGFVAGLMVGFTGVQGIFGTGVVSITIAVVMALIVGAIMAILSFVFFDLAVVILTMMLGWSLLSYLGVAIGLGDNGFILFLLGLAGAIFGLIIATSGPFSTSLVVVVTSMIGVTFVLAGVLLLVGSITLDDLNEIGIIRSTLNVVDNAFLWFIVWIGATAFAVVSQTKTLSMEVMDDSLAYLPKK